MNADNLDNQPDKNTVADFASDRNSNGFFIITEETADFEAPDPSLDQAERITQALEIFDASVGSKIKNAYVVV